MSRLVAASFRLLTLFALHGCSVSADAGGGGDDVGGFGWGGSYGGGSSAGGAGQGGSEPPGPFTYAALCGIQDCVPGNLLEPCTPSEGGAPGVGGGGEGGFGGANGGPPPGGGAEGGAGGAAAGGSGEGGGASESFACQIIDRREEPAAVCSPSGTTLINGVCNSSADCLPGNGCVLATNPDMGEGGGPPAPPVGICRPYCCDSLEACPTETFCAPQPMFDAAAGLEDPTVALPIPVCMPIQTCLLLGADCPAGQTCSVVRADGSTSCVAIGEGGLCDPCPCSEGFLCNFGTGRCLQLCDTATNECPGSGALCQGGGALPDAVGVCVGGESLCDP